MQYHEAECVAVPSARAHPFGKAVKNPQKRQRRQNEQQHRNRIADKIFLAQLRILLEQSRNEPIRHSRYVIIQCVREQHHYARFYRERQLSRNPLEPIQPDLPILPVSARLMNTQRQQQQGQQSRSEADRHDAEASTVHYIPPIHRSGAVVVLGDERIAHIKQHIPASEVIHSVIIVPVEPFIGVGNYRRAVAALEVYLKDKIAFVRGVIFKNRDIIFRKSFGICKLAAALYAVIVKISAVFVIQLHKTIVQTVENLQTVVPEQYQREKSGVIIVISHFKEPRAAQSVEGRDEQ